MKWTPTIAVLLLSSTLSAQGNRWWNEQHYFGKQTSDQNSLWGDFDYRMRSNRLTNELMNGAVWQGSIDHASSAYMEDEDPSLKTNLEAGVDGALWYRIARNEGWSFNIGFGMEELALGSFQTGLAQLYLRGNGPFEDQTLPLGPSWMNYMSFQYVGFGIDKRNEHLAYGLSAQLIKVSRYQKIDVHESSLYTAPYGAYLNAVLDFDMQTTSSGQDKLGAWYGTGLGLNAFYVYEGSSKNTLFSFQANHIGAAHFNGIRSYNFDRDSLFSGIEMDNILELQNELNGSGNLDSVEALIGLVPESSSHLALLPGSVQFNLVQQIGGKGSLCFEAKQYFQPVIPQIRIGYAIRFHKAFGIEPFVRTGGYTNFDYGISMFSQPSTFLQLIVCYELIESQLAKASSTSQSLSFGGQILF